MRPPSSHLKVCCDDRADPPPDRTPQLTHGGAAVVVWLNAWFITLPLANRVAYDLLC